MSRRPYNHLFTTVSIGKTKSGKTQYLLRLTGNRFNTKHDMTPFVEFGVKNIDHGNKRITFRLWDTAGKPPELKQKCITYLRGASLFALFVDLSEKNLMNPDVESESIEDLRHYDLSKHFDPIAFDPMTSQPYEEPITPQCFVIFTKNDLVKGPLPSDDELQNIATQAMAAAKVPEEHRIPDQFMLTSALTGENIEETLTAFANALLPLPAPTLSAFVLPKTKESWWDRNFGSSETEDDNPPQYENHFTF